MKISLLFYRKWAVKMTGMVRIWADNSAFWPDIVRWPTVIPRPVKGLRVDIKILNNCSGLGVMYKIHTGNIHLQNPNSRYVSCWLPLACDLRYAARLLVWSSASEETSDSTSESEYISEMKDDDVIQLFENILVNMDNIFYFLGPVHMSKSYPG